MREQVVLYPVGAGLEGLIGRQIQKPMRSFGKKQFVDGLETCARVISVDRVDAQAAAVGWELFDIPQAQTLRRKYALNSMQRQVREVLVVDGVELALLDELKQVRKF